jgi:NADH dehydrogenase
MQQSPAHRVVIIGGGFGGIEVAKALKHAPVEIALVDRRNFHLFQPLLYQVATAGLSPGEIAAPLRGIFRRQDNVDVYLAEVIDVNAAARHVLFSDGAELAYDTLIVASGSRDFYFGHDKWKAIAPGLKTVEDALEIRRRVLLAFEAAERENDLAARQAWLSFVVVGGGPTGVELAGALGEIANHTLRGDFRHIDPADATILLIEGAARVLPSFPADLSEQVVVALRHLGVTVRTGTKVTDIREDGVVVADSRGTEQIPARTVLWAAGVQASPLGRVLEARAGASLDRAGRVIVEPDLSLPGHPEILVIGDLAHFNDAEGKPLPGVAPVAMQQGRYAAKLICRRLQGQRSPAFRYENKGSLATIGRAAAVTDFGRLRLHGFPAWVIWLFIHLLYIVAFESRLLILIQWAWNYFTRNRGARLITGEDILPRVDGGMSDRLPPSGS